MKSLVKWVGKVCIIFLVSSVLVVPAVLVEAVGKPEAGPAAPPNPPPGPTPEQALAFLRSRISAVGLIDSYIEDNIDHSYTYDNALATMAFISAGDITSARTILDAFVAIGPQPEGGFLDRYRTNTGAPDGTLSVGPNAYLLQAMNLYYLQTADSRYNTLARGIADYVLSLQDLDGGIFGLAGVTWKSTENNLGALSGIHNLGVLQNLPTYVDRANQIRNFLITECWDGTRFLRGENDSIIVTDVQALGGMILGPAYKNGAYWVEGYTLTTKRYSGRKSVTGFDFNDDKDTVWTEGTFQETMAFLVAGDTTKYSFYRTEAEKLFNSSSGAFWLASNTGTTGGWWILYKWQAVAPTSWYIYAYNQDNVLELLP